MRTSLSLLVCSFFALGALALTADAAEAKGFSFKKLQKGAKRATRRASSSAKRYTRPASSRAYTTRGATRSVRRAPTRSPARAVAGRPGVRPAPLDTRRKYYTRQFPTGSRGYLHRPSAGLPAFGAPTATGRAPTMAERFYTRNQITRNGAPMTGGRYASQARQARQATQARQARNYQQYRMPAWNQRRR